MCEKKSLAYSEYPNGENRFWISDFESLNIHWNI